MTAETNQNINAEQDTKEQPETFGSCIVQKLPEGKRDDVEETRLFFTATLDRLHLTLGANQDSQVAQILLQQAINQTITAQMWVERALYYSQEIGIDVK